MDGKSSLNNCTVSGSVESPGPTATTDFSLQFSSSNQSFNYENYNQEQKTSEKYMENTKNQTKSSKNSNSEGEKVSDTNYRTSWAYLLKRVFDVDVFACPPLRGVTT